MSPSRKIPISILIGGIIVAGTVYLTAPRAPENNPSLVRPVSAADHIFGNPAARVVIVEYTDFDCEYCRTFHDTLHQIIANEGAKGEVAWVLRHFPLAEIHPNALALARAAECAATIAGNDGFWRFSDALYASQPVAPIGLGAIAAAARIPGDAFASCYSTAPSALDGRILADRENALAMGAEGTPFSIILADGKSPVVMIAAYSYDAVRELVNQALGE